MRLVGKARGGGNIGQWSKGGGELAGGVVDPQPPLVLTQRAAIDFAEPASQMDRVRLHLLRDFGQGDPFREPVGRRSRASRSQRGGEPSGTGSAWRAQAASISSARPSTDKEETWSVSRNSR
jgi:hypothetical protein